MLFPKWEGCSVRPKLEVGSGDSNAPQPVEYDLFR